MRELETKQILEISDLHPFETQIPARLDRLPWSRFHLLIIMALGITWILDGLEVTLTAAITGVLQEAGTLHFTAAELGLTGSAYLIGAVSGALVFGYLTDLFGRKKLFFLTLAVYLTGTLLTGFSWNLASFAFFRAITGAGIGGEYAAVNSAIDELIPARIRGRVDLIVNGSFWIGAAVGSIGTVILLDPAIFRVNVGWRLGFGMGAVLGLIILVLRKYIPESPRWLATHGQQKKAEATVYEIEETVERDSGKKLLPPEGKITIYPRTSFGFGIVVRTMLTRYPTRSLLGLALMIAQAFLYNSVSFTYALVLTNFYGVPTPDTGIYLLPFALANFAGPLTLGHFFDTIGRRPMISLTYAGSALLLIVTGYLFSENLLSTMTQTVLWSMIFFIASPAASSAYLTVSEIFPLEIRAMAIAFYYALGTAAGGIIAPWFFGALVSTDHRSAVFHGYLIAAALMLAAAGIEVLWGVKAERVSLESIAAPLSAEEGHS